MKLPIKIWQIYLIITILVGSLIFYQYNVTFGWIFSQNTVDDLKPVYATNPTLKKFETKQPPTKIPEKNPGKTKPVTSRGSDKTTKSLTSRRPNKIPETTLFRSSKPTRRSETTRAAIFRLHEQIAELKKLAYALDDELPPLFIITPTYRRCEQLAEITRLAHTLMLVPKLHWLVIEEAKNKSQLITELLLRTGLSFSHLLAPMPEEYDNDEKPIGVPQRNKGLEWIRKNANTGVFYFADDDNTYDLDLFNEMRYTKKVSMFPVGLVTDFGVSTPIVNNGKFAGFYDGWIGGRKFPVDMAGFAVSVKFLLERPKAIMPFNLGFQETGFLESLAPFEPKELELLAANCTKILVWHTKTIENAASAAIDISKFNNTNIIRLKEILV